MIKTHDEILGAEFQSKILAHTLFQGKPETLIAHSKKTLSYCDSLIEKLSLEEIFIKMLSELVSEKQIPTFFELIRSIIYHHDLGKINPIFQKEKMRNDLQINADALNSTHSFYGKMLFDNLFYTDFDAEIDNVQEQHLFFLLSQTIDRHHSSLMDVDFLGKKIMLNENSTIKELIDLNNTADKIFTSRKKFYTIKSIFELNSFKNDNQSDIRKIFTEKQRESLFYLYKTIFSLMIMSDYYATLNFMHGVEYFDKISIISDELKIKCKENFYNVEFNRKLNDKAYCENLLNSQLCDIHDLNKMRAKILLEADKKLEETLVQYPEQRIFYLNVPTGGGKTNISLKLALTLLNTRNIKRVFYVFPFINIIEQNHGVIKNTFGLNEELSAIYSTSTWELESENKDEHLQYVLDNEFLNYPFVVMSNVNFFNTFVKSGKTSNYRLVNLANSVVVLDEIQSLNDKDWTLFNDLLKYASKYLNIYFIIMSATLPRLDSLSDIDDSNDALNLIDNPNVFFNHPLFKNRLSIEYRNNVNDLDQLIILLKEEIRDNMNKILLVVNTIKNSLELYKKIKNEQTLENFQIYLLNSTLLPNRRSEIIEKMKGSDKIILVSTQSVEAGIDIDCDFGIRDFAIFDSIEQIAGRINRNSKDEIHPYKLIVVNLKENEEKTASYIYGETFRWKTIENDFMLENSVNDFLKNRNFNEYYTKVLEYIKNHNKATKQKSSQTTVKQGIRGLNFEDLNKINIIEDDSMSIMINADVSKNEFSEVEKKEIERKGIVYHNDKINGKDIWSKYNEFIKNFQMGHVDKKIETKIWSSILSKFMINLSNRRSKKQDVLNLNKGIPLLRSEFYSNEEGVNRDLLDANSFEVNSNINII